MNTIDIKFNECVSLINGLTTTQNLTNDILLALYKYFKQATIGDCNQAKPYFFNYKAAAKWEAWKSISGLDKQEAKNRYIELVESLNLNNL